MTNNKTWFMKIGILTFHRAFNYGAFLQAFSLKNTLTTMGHEVSFVDYWPHEHSSFYSLFRKTDFNKGVSRAIKSLIIDVLQARRFIIRKRKMSQMQKNYLNLDSNPEFVEPRSIDYCRYDVVIYGSDQIWWKARLGDYKGYDSVYWGEYAKNVFNIAYAPSMGVIDINSDDRQIITRWLMNFKSLSVRESSLKEILSSMSNQDISVVLDPVFLTSADTWRSYAKKPKIKKPYVLLFNLMNSPQASEIAKSIAKENNLQMVEVTSKVLPFKYGINCYQTQDAFEFIGWIDNADFVVSSSFHGTAFSVIFNKQFVSLGMKNNSGRVQSLLDMLSISNRLIESKTKEIYKTIDYETINVVLAEKIKESKQYLIDSLSMAKI